MNEILKCANLHKSYGKNEAVRNLDLKLEENTVYGLFGRNGAGKTTLLNMITGGIFPDHGDIKIGGRPLKPGESPGDTCYIREKNFILAAPKSSKF